MNIKIAVVTEDGERISNHFGTAPYYKVFEVQDGQIVSEEMRPKPHNEHHVHHHSEEHHHEEEHEQSRRRGAEMLAAVSDCQVLISGGMGRLAYQHAQASNMAIYMTGGKIEEAVQAYLRGELTSNERRVHR